MPASPYYDRLRQVSELGHLEMLEDLELNAVRVQLKTARELVARVMDEPGITGEVKAAISQRLHEDLLAFHAHEKNLATLRTAYDNAQKAMQTAKQAFANLSPELLSTFETGLKTVTNTVSFAGSLLPVDEYLTEVESQKNAERELAAKQALDDMNSKLMSNSKMNLERPQFGDSGDGGGAGDGGAGRGGAGGGSVGGGSLGGGGGSVGSPGGSGLQTPGGGSAGGGALAGAAVGAAPVAASLLPSKLRTSSNGVMRPATPFDPATYKTPSWPQDALTAPIGARMTADGPTGGYVPVSVTDPNNPAWRSDYTNPAFPGVGAPKTSGIVGGIVTAGAAAAAARGAAGGFGGGATVGGLGVGGTSVGGYGAPYAGAVPSAGVGGGTGSTATGAARAAGTGSATVRPGGGTGPMGIPGAYGAAGSGKKKDEKKKHGLVGYQVVRLDDDEAGDPVDPSLFGAGDAESLTPLDRPAEDTW